jgi:hypothetical protein
MAKQENFYRKALMMIEAVEHLQQVQASWVVMINGHGSLLH